MSKLSLRKKNDKNNKITGFFTVKHLNDEHANSDIPRTVLQDIENKSKPEKPQERMQDDVRYECEHCEYKAKLKHHLTIHTQATHEGIRFHCNLCSYKGSSPGQVEVHQRVNHRGKKTKVIANGCKACVQTAT